MNKAIRTLCSCIFLLLIFTLTGCPFLGDDIKNYECVTAQELTDYMNSLEFGTTFELKDSKYYSDSSMKMLVVYLKAQDMPDKTVKAYQLFTFDYCYYDDTLKNSRTSFPTVGEFRYTDYYFVKYEDEVVSHFENLLAPITTEQGLEKGKTYSFAIKPVYYGLDIKKRGVAGYEDIQYFQSAQEFLEKAKGAYVYCLINSDLVKGSDMELRYHSLCYDILNSSSYFDRYSYMTFYFTKKYSAATVTAKELEAKSFYTNGDIKSGAVIVKEK